MRPNLCRPLFPVLYRFAKKCISAAGRSSWDTIFGKFWLIFSFQSRRMFSHSRLNISWQFALSLELLLTCTRWVRVKKGLEKTFGDFFFFIKGFWMWKFSTFMFVLYFSLSLFLLLARIYRFTLVDVKGFIAWLWYLQNFSFKEV